MSKNVAKFRKNSDYPEDVQYAPKKSKPKRVESAELKSFKIQQYREMEYSEDEEYAPMRRRR